MPNVDYAGPVADSSFRRMAMASWAHPSDPTIYGFMDIDVEAAAARMDAARAEGLRVTWTHVVARAVAVAMGRMPDVNVMPRLGRIWQRSRVDVFLQVALPSADGVAAADLSGVKVKDADKKLLGDFAREVAERVDRVRSGTDEELRDSKRRIDRIPRLLMRPMLRLVRVLQYVFNWDLRWAGLPRDPFGSALVTSLGMMGIDTAFAPLFPIGGPPIVLLVGGVKLRPVVDDAGQVVARRMLRVCGTFDHRVFDGYHVASFARVFQDVLTEEAHAL